MFSQSAIPFSKILDIYPVDQTGHNCKITAIAAIEKYFSEKNYYLPIPLHKKNTAFLSIRQLAKNVGSQQGELLEIAQVEKIMTLMDYSLQIQDCVTEELFKEIIISQLSLGSPIITYFAVDRISGLPSAHYDENEHSALIIGYEEIHDQVTIMHWGKKYKCSLTQLFNSMKCLPTQRNVERYYSVKETNRIQKYELVDENEAKQTTEINPNNPTIKKSITPQLNSGFQSKLILIKKTYKLPKMRQRRRAAFLLQLNINSFFKKISKLNNKTIESKTYSEAIHKAIDEFYFQNIPWQTFKKSLEKIGQDFCEEMHNKKLYDYKLNANKLPEHSAFNLTKKIIQQFNKYIISELVLLNKKDQETIINLLNYLQPDAKNLKFISTFHKDCEDAVLIEDIDKINSFMKFPWIKNQASTFLHIACEKGKKKSVKMLLQIPDININSLDPIESTTPLYSAVKNNHIAIVKELLEVKGINVDQINKNNSNALCAAIDEDNVEIIHLLLDAGSNPSTLTFRPSKLQDINSRLQKNIQYCLIKSMKQLGYYSRDTGVCYPFSIVMLFVILSQGKSFISTVNLLSALRKLRLNEYQLTLKEEKLKPGYIYVKKINQGIEYKILADSGEIITDICELKINENAAWNLKTITPHMPTILKTTLQRGHTKLSDLKIMQREHNQLIEQAEKNALQEMECKDINDLNINQKQQFRELVLKKTQELRKQLPLYKQTKENLFIQIIALFEPMELILNTFQYPHLFPFKNPYNTNNITQGFVFQAIKPIILEKTT
ncbi:MAG: ankyrin repeat domain-containing protein [Gammaproteobacteria bacterium]|nr:ankyrin repeat domain-containing protein [Gammaproteobacteria bacterium]